jgi:hypothetical protein
MRINPLLHPATLVLASGLILAPAGIVFAEQGGSYSFENADTDHSGTLSQEEYDKATQGMSAELEQFKSQDRSEMIKKTAPTGSATEKPEAEAEATPFKSQDRSEMIEKTAPTGSATEKPEAEAEPTPFKSKSGSIKSE